MPAIRALFIRLYKTVIKEPVKSYTSSARIKSSSAYGSGPGSGSTGSRSRVRSIDPYHAATKSSPDNPKQFIQLQEVESGNDSLSTLPPAGGPKTKRHSIFSRRPSEPRSPGSATLPSSPGAGSARLSWLKDTKQYP
jgi:hypothetical protein